MIMVVTTKNAQWMNFNKKKKSMIVTMMTVDLQMFRLPSLKRQTCVFIAIETNRLHYRDTIIYVAIAMMIGGQKNLCSKYLSIYPRK